LKCLQQKNSLCNDKKKTGNTSTEINLFSIQGKNIELSFSGNRISSDGGLLLLRELDSQLIILLSTSNCIHDERESSFVSGNLQCRKKGVQFTELLL